MRLFIINTFQSAADQLCPENDEDRWFFCIWLTRRRRLVYFAISAAWKKRSYAGEDGLSGFLFWVLLRDKKKRKKRERKGRKRKKALALVWLWFVWQVWHSTVWVQMRGLWYQIYIPPGEKKESKERKWKIFIVLRLGLKKSASPLHQ